MGYAGYVPAKYAPAPPTAVQAALYAVQSVAALELIAKLTKNVVVSPTGVRQSRWAWCGIKVKPCLPPHAILACCTLIELCSTQISLSILLAFDRPAPSCKCEIYKREV